MLVVRGEAGIGKSALLDYVETGAAGCRIARLAGVEAEMELAYGGLHQLCAPFLDDLTGCPSRSACSRHGVRPEWRAGPGRFLVGLAVLDLLADLAEERPLVCLIDDAHWLDRVSAQTVAFVARRLAERIVMVIAVREPPRRRFAGLPSSRSAA